MRSTVEFQSQKVSRSHILGGKLGAVNGSQLHSSVSSPCSKRIQPGHAPRDVDEFVLNLMHGW